MCHLGDPLEDLAWGLNRIWCWARDERVGGLLPKEQAIGVWEASSGLAADRTSLHWWELFWVLPCRPVNAATFPWRDAPRHKLLSSRD